MNRRGVAFFAVSGVLIVSLVFIVAYSLTNSGAPDAKTGARQPGEKAFAIPIPQGPFLTAEEHRTLAARQAEDCVLEGTIRDAGEKRLEGAEVTVLSNQKIAAKLNNARLPWLNSSASGSSPTESDWESLLRGSPKGRSGPGGRYEVRQIAPGDHTILVRSSAHLCAEDSIVLSPGERRRQDFVLHLGAKIAGRVVDLEGNPVPVASVEALPARLAATRGFGRLLTERAAFEQGRFASTHQQKTGPDGQFQFLGLEREEMVLVAHAEGFCPKSVDSVYPGGEDIVLRMERGGTIVAQVMQEKPGSTVITVDIIRDFGLQTAGFHSVERRLGEHTFARVRSLALEVPGRLEASGLSAGGYRLKLSATKATTLLIDNINLRSGESVDLGNIQLPPQASIQGRVSDPRGSAAEGVLVRALQAGLGREEWHGSTVAGEALVETHTDAKGSFLLRGLADGEHDLEFWSANSAPGLRRGVRTGPEMMDVRLDPGFPLEGIVVRADSGSPVSRAIIRSPPAQEAVSGDDGRFELRGLPVNSQQGTIAAQNLFYIVAASGFREARNQILWRPNLQNAILRISLSPLIHLSGTVSTDEGELVEGALVRVVIPGSAEKLVTSPNVAVTNAQGGFEIWTESLDVRGGPSLPVLTATHPVHGVGISLPLDERETDRSGIEIPLSSGRTLQGRIRDSEGNPLPNALVEMHRVPIVTRETMLADVFGTQEPLRTSRSGLNGRVIFSGLLPGEYVVKATLGGYGPARSTVSVSQSQNEVELVLPADSWVNGRVHDPFGRPIPDTEVLALYPLLSPAASDEDIQMIYAQASGIARARTDPNGTFTIDSLPAEPVTVVARHGGHEIAFVRDVKPGTSNVDLVLIPFASVTLKVMSDQSRLPLSRYSVKLSYVGEGDSNAMSHLWNVRGYGIREVDSVNGQCAFDAVPAGDHELVIEARGYLLYEKRLSLSPGELRGMEVSMSLGLRLQGTARSRTSGNPVPWATVFLQPKTGTQGGYSRSNARVKTESNGGFEIQGIPTGEYVMSVKHAEYAPLEAIPIKIAQDTVIEPVFLEPGSNLIVEAEWLRLPKGQILLDPAFGTSTPLRMTALGGDIYISSSIPPGEYEIVARPHGGPDLRNGRIVLMPHKEHRLKVTVRQQ